MIQAHRPIPTQRRLLLFKWLMVFLPPIAVSLGHGLLDHPGGGHFGDITQDLPAHLLVIILGIGLTYIFVETLFRVLWKLQAEALSREQDMQTMGSHRKVVM